MPIRVARGNKYNAKKMREDGHVFDSGDEFKRYCQLKLLEKAGEISNLEVHPKYEFIIDGRPILIRSDRYPNGRIASFKPDFRYLKPGVGIVVEDKKSKPTREIEAYRLRKALFECLFYPARVEEV